MDRKEVLQIVEGLMNSVKRTLTKGEMCTWEGSAVS